MSMEDGKRRDDQIITRKKAVEICNEGYTHGLKGNFAEALSSFEKALELDPSLAVAWSNKGVILAKINRIKESITCLEEAVRLKPVSFSIWMTWAEVLILAGDYEEALKKSEKATKLSFRDARPWITRGNSLVKLGRLKEALDCYQKAISIDNVNLLAWKNKRTVLKILKQHDEVISCYERLIEIDPHDIKHWLGEGLLLEDLDRDEEALNCYQRAIKANPDSVLIWISLGRLKEKHEELEEAIEAYNRALSIDPTLLEARRHLTALSGRGREEELIKAMEEDPENREIYIELGHHYLSQNQLEHARQTLSKALLIYPHDHELLNSMAWLLIEQGKLQEARAILNSLLASGRDFSRVYFAMGMIHMKENDLGPAEKELRKALSMNPHNTSCQYYLGLILTRVGRFQEALREFTQLEKIEARKLSIKLEIGSIFIKQGHGAEAESIYRSILSLDPQMPGAKEGLVLSLTLQKKHDEAEELLQEMQKSGVSSPLYLLYSIGCIYNQKNDPQRAREIWNKMDEIQILTGEEYVLRATVLCLQGDTRRAEQICEEGLQKNPDNLNLTGFLGWLKSLHSNFAEAEKLFFRIIEKMPGFPDGPFNIARLYWRMGRKKEAVEWFKKAIVPESDSTLTTITAEGFLNLFLRNYREARNSALKVIQREAGCADAHYLLGMIACGEGAFDQAEKHLRQALHLVPYSNEYRQALDSLTSGQGKREQTHHEQGQDFRCL